MNRIKVFLTLLVSSLVLVSPQFFVKYPGLIDDGSDLLYVKEHSFWRIIFDQLFVGERSRPLRYIIKKILFEIFGLNVWGYFLVGAVLLALNAYILYLIMNRLKIKKWVIFWGTLFFLTSTPVIENFYRLGTDEGWQLLLLLIAMYHWLGKRKSLSLLFFITSLFIKESSWFYLLVPIFFFYKEKRWRLLVVSAVVWLGFGDLTMFKFSHTSSIYIHKMSFSVLTLWQNFKLAKEYFFFLALIFFYFIKVRIRTVTDRKNRQLIWGLILVAMAPLFFWNMYTSYYYLILSTLIVVALCYISSILPINLNIYALILLVFLLGVQIKFGSLKEMKTWHDGYIANGALSGYLLKNDFNKIKVFSKVDHYEMNDKIYIYIDEWKNNNGSNFVPDIEMWRGTAGDIDDTRRKKMAEESMESFIKSELNNKLLISEGQVVLNQGFLEEAVCGQSIFSGKICKFYIYKPR